MSHWSHWIYAGLGAMAMFPIKMIWDSWLSKFWTGFWGGLKAGFKQTPAGSQFMQEFYTARAAKTSAIAAAHPEIAKLLHCMECQGKGCDDCGGTGWA